MSKCIFISADHGLSIVYFLQSEVVSSLLDAGIKIVLLTDEAILEQIRKLFDRPRLVFESLRLRETSHYFQHISHSKQWWLDFLRRAGASNRINLEAVDSYIHQVEAEAHSRRKILYPLMKVAVGGLRRSKYLRKKMVRWQKHYTSQIYDDLFKHYQPDLVLASTPGWRWDRYILREASTRGIQTGSVIVGWDNTSSYSLPGAPVNWITCWSQIQKDELILGSDWKPEEVNIGGIPSYDGYFLKNWQIPRDQYFHQHNLNPDKKLISYACSFVSFSPNIQNIQAITQLIASNSLAEPCQLLVRYHPNHFADVPRFAAERLQIQQLASENEDVHVVEPVPLGGSLGYYSGEDMPEKSSMMAHSDVFTTVYSTMVVEASIHNKPVVSICIDSPVGWPGKFTLPLSQIGGWPTHSRFRDSGAGCEALDLNQLRDAINYYLAYPQANHLNRTSFIERECTFTDGSAGKRTADYILSKITT